MIYNNDEMPTKEWLEKHKKHEKLFKMLWPNNSEHKSNQNNDYKSKLNSNFLRLESNKNEQNDLKIKYNYDSTIRHYNRYDSVCNCMKEKEVQNLRIKSLEYEIKLTENSMSKIYENILDDLKLMKNEMNIIRFINYNNSINNKNK